MLHYSVTTRARIFKVYPNSPPLVAKQLAQKNHCVHIPKLSSSKKALFCSFHVLLACNSISKATSKPTEPTTFSLSSRFFRSENALQHKYALPSTLAQTHRQDLQLE
jgi:hypothetical protein